MVSTRTERPRPCTEDGRGETTVSTSLLAALVYSRRRRSSPGRSVPGGVRWDELLRACCPLCPGPRRKDDGSGLLCCQGRGRLHRLERARVPRLHAVGTVLITFYIPASFARCHRRRSLDPAPRLRSCLHRLGGNWAWRGGGASVSDGPVWAEDSYHRFIFLSFAFVATSSSIEGRKSRQEKDARVRVAFITACFRVCGRVCLVSVRAYACASL